MRSWIAQIPSAKTLSSGAIVSFSFDDFVHDISTSDQVFLVGRRDPTVLYGWGSVVEVNHDEKIVVGDDEEAHTPPYSTYYSISVRVLCKNAFVLPLSLSEYLSAEDFKAFEDEYTNKYGGVVAKVSDTLASKLSEAIGDCLGDSMASIFLSHSHVDKPFARRLANDLVRIGIRVWIDEAEIRVGDSLIEKIREGIDSVQYVGVVLSKTSVKSEWVKKEVDIAMNQEIEGKRVKVLPLLVDDCDPPGFLKGKRYADFRREDLYQREFIELAKRLGVNAILRKTIYGRWVGITGLLSLAQHGEDIIGEYQWYSKKWDGDIVGKIIEERLIFRWNLKNGSQHGVGFFDISNDKLYGAYWFHTEAPSYLSILADPNKISNLLITGGNVWNFKRV